MFLVRVFHHVCVFVWLCVWRVYVSDCAAQRFNHHIILLLLLPVQVGVLLRDYMLRHAALTKRCVRLCVSLCVILGVFHGFFDTARNMSREFL